MNLERFAWLSVGAAFATIALKTLAWWLTGSVGLLSDALESIVNLAAALLAVTMLRVAASPPDENHPYGFSKAEYFAAGIEGALIVLAAAGILASAIPRLLEPEPLESPGLGAKSITFQIRPSLPAGFVTRAHEAPLRRNTPPGCPGRSDSRSVAAAPAATRTASRRRGA